MSATNRDRPPKGQAARRNRGALCAMHKLDRRPTPRTIRPCLRLDSSRPSARSEGAYPLQLLGFSSEEHRLIIAKRFNVNRKRNNNGLFYDSDYDLRSEFQFGNSEN